MTLAKVLSFRPPAPAAATSPPDRAQRQSALDIRASWIVEAPAGSGKTGLLIQRYLKLLGDAGVDQPEQVLAITFTVKATAEMRERVVEQLEAAAAGAEAKDAFERETRALAQSVLVRDASLAWGLLSRPERLNFRTIDSVCAEIARSLPVLSGSGGRLRPVREPDTLYREAARKTLMQLGGPDAALDHALRTLLLHRDGNLRDCEKLIAQMLGSREQWGRLIPLRTPDLTEEFLDTTVLPKLEKALELAICQALTQLSRSMPADVLRDLTATAAEFASLDGYRGAVSPIAFCIDRYASPGDRAEHLAHWRALARLVVTPSQGAWRKGFNKNQVMFETQEPHKSRLRSLVERLRDRDDLLEAMCLLDKLPPATYPQEQWTVAKALFRILSRALVELQIVFNQRGQCDFAEMALAANAALTAETGLEDLVAVQGAETRHLLVDEMQDTSSSQYDLIERLTRGWDGHSQTLFLVGDPKQSIYRFRQARVERFIRTMKEQRLGDIVLGSLRLTANFRSQRHLVERFNEAFSKVFPPKANPAHLEDVSYLSAVAVREPSASANLMWHTATVDADAGNVQSQSRKQAREVREIAMQWLGYTLPSGKPVRVAVLLRSRSHLGRIAAELNRDDGEGAVPFFSTEIDALGERQEVLDLLGLTRALLHPADRVAWLAVLHAPWCGLGLADLHMLAGADDAALRHYAVLDLMSERGHLLSEDGEERLARVWIILKAATEQRGRMPLPQLVERTWRSLGADAYLNVEEQANATRFFLLLDELEAEGGITDARQITGRIARLFAEPPVKEDAVELITIHRAKGLEWDVVIVPAMERRAQQDRGKLLDWMEVDSGEEETAQVVLAPITGKGEGSSELHTWIRSVEASRETAERKRLLYVACTRAREELHLFAMLRRTARGAISVPPNSLLNSAWPIAQAQFEDGEKVIPITDRSPTDEAETFLGAIAASDEGVEDLAAKPPILHRLPLGYDPLADLRRHAPLLSKTSEDRDSRPAFDRPEGSFAARSFGNAVHDLLDLAAEKLAEGKTVAEVEAEFPQWLPRVSALLRADGLAPAMVDKLAKRVVDALRKTLSDPGGRWILSPHPGAANEVAIIGWANDSERSRASLRLDRIFLAGANPGEPGETFLWIVDYKTGNHGSEGLDDFLANERRKYQPQLEAYARTITNMHSQRQQPIAGLRLALYYPSLPKLDWWAFATV